MHKFLLPSALAIALAASAGVALADSNHDKVAATSSLSADQVASRLQSQGLTVRKIKLDDGRYKVKAVDSTGHKQKLSVNPATGDVLAKSDDDGDGD